MSIIINGQIECCIDTDILIQHCNYFKSLFSNNFIENKEKKCNITIEFLKSPYEWLSIESIINIYNNKDIKYDKYNLLDKSNFYNSKYIKSNIYILEYIQALDVLDYYLSDLKNYIIIYYDLISDNALLLFNTLECCDLFNLKIIEDIKQIEIIFFKKDLDIKYLDLKQKILDTNLQQLKNKSMSKYKKERSLWKLYSIYKWLYENNVTIVD